MQPQPSSRRIRSRRAAALASVTLLTLAVSTAAGSGRPPTAGPSGAGAGPAVSPARATTLAPCMIAGGSAVQMSEGVPTPGGYARSTGRVRALSLMIDFSDARARGTR